MNNISNKKYILYFVSFIILIAILYLLGNNLVNIYNRNTEILNEKINNLDKKINNNIIHKKINTSESILNNIPINNLEEKIKNHMDYKHGNPLMYNEKVNKLYNDLE